MPMRFSTALRSDRSQNIVTRAGTNPRLKFYDGSPPTVSGNSPTGTLLGTVSVVGPFGTVVNGVLTVNVNISQNAATHVAGTPTWVVLETSTGVFVADWTIPDSFTYNGSIAPNVPIILEPSSITEGNI